MARLKYVPLSKHCELYKESQLLLRKNKSELFKADKIAEKRVRDRFD